MSEYIYGLLDPTTSGIRYIGKSNNPHRRLGEHINDQADCSKTAWIRRLKLVGLGPILVILEEVQAEEDIFDAEERWIGRGIQLGWELTNDTKPAFLKLTDAESLDIVDSVAKYIAANYLDRIVLAAGREVESIETSDPEIRVKWESLRRKGKTIRWEDATFLDIQRRYGKDFTDILVTLCADHGDISGATIEGVYRQMTGRSMNGKTRSTIREVIIARAIGENSL